MPWKATVPQFYYGHVHKLYKVESKELQAKSSIGVFVCFNVALIVDQGTQHITYFVNKVERTQTTTLWSNILKAKLWAAPTGIFGYTLVETLYKWLSIITDLSAL